jgi:hypothetical protein
MFVLLLFVGQGCVAENSRQPVSGVVTFQGKPLDNGTITFLSTGSNAGPVCGAPVVGGRFTVPAEQGLAPGTYKVTISAPEPGGTLTPEQKAAGASANAKESLPAKYNDASELTATVDAGKPSVLKFELD